MLKAKCPANFHIPAREQNVIQPYGLCTASIHASIAAVKRGQGIINNPLAGELSPYVSMFHAVPCFCLEMLSLAGSPEVWKFEAQVKLG